MCPTNQSLSHRSPLRQKEFDFNNVEMPTPEERATELNSRREAQDAEFKRKWSTPLARAIGTARESEEQIYIELPEGSASEIELEAVNNLLKEKGWKAEVVWVHPEGGRPEMPDFRGDSFEYSSQQLEDIRDAQQTYDSTRVYYLEITPEDQK